MGITLELTRLSEGDVREYQTITTSYRVRVGETVRIGDRLLHVWHKEGITLSLRREPVNRWGNKMARWRERRAR